MLSRRSFLTGTSALSLIAATPVYAQTTLLSGGTINTFNGGRSQVNFNFINGGGEFPFIDVVKSGGDWNNSSAPNANGTVSPGLRDANGYPTSIQSGGYFKQAFIPSQTERPGNYVCRWTGGGAGTVMRSPGTVVSGSASGANGRFVFSTSSSQINIGVNTMGSPYVTSISVMHVDDEASWLAGEIFGAQFLSVLRQANFGVLRFLNWQNGNAGANTTWGNRKPITYSGWSSAQWFPDSWIATVTNSGNDYSATLGSGAPVDKQIIHLQWNSDSTVASTAITISNGSPAVVNWPAHSLSVGTIIGITAGNPNAPMSTGVNYYVSNVIDGDNFNISLTLGGANLNTTSTSSGLSACVPATLNLNGTGGVPVKDPVSNPAVGSTKPLSTSSSVAIFATLVYDADLNSWLMFGGTLNGFSSGFSNGVPPEICFQLALELGAHPWFVAPYLAIDPMTDWFTRLATYLKAAAPPWMIPRLEGCNEQWNNAGGFFGTRYGWAKANAHWGTQFDQNNWQGKVMSTIGQAVNAVYGGAVGAGYQLVNGAQTVSFSSTGSANSNDPRMTSAQYVAQAAAPQVGYTKSAASGWCTHLCIANYFSPSEFGTAAETTHAADYAAAAGNAALQLQIATAYADTLAGAASGFNLAQQRVYFGFAFTWTQKFTNGAGDKIKMCCYEGGYSPDLSGTSQVNTLRNASKAVADIGKAISGGTFVSGDVVTGNYLDFVNASGEFPSCFQLAGANNIWSVLDPDVYVSPQTPQWLAIVGYNH